jgi:hypothetical protein
MEALLQHIISEYGSDDTVSIPKDELAEILERVIAIQQPKSIKLKGKATRDPNRPKRGKSAFFIWSADNRVEVREDLVWSAKHGGIEEGAVYKNGKLTVTLPRVSKELGRRWKEISDEDKAPYEAQATAERERYRTEKAAYDAEHGIVVSKWVKRSLKFDTETAYAAPYGWSGPFDGYLEQSPKDPDTGKSITKGFHSFEEACQEAMRLECGGITRTRTGYKLRMATTVSINDASRAKGEISWTIGRSE